MLYYFKNRRCVMKKKYKYENSTVFMAIALLAMFIVFPPLARIFYPEENMGESSESRVFLYCSKESEQEGFRVTSSVYYLNNQVLYKKLLDYLYPLNNSLILHFLHLQLMNHYLLQHYNLFYYLQN